MTQRTTTFVAASFFLGLTGSAFAASPMLHSDTPPTYFSAAITLQSDPSHGAFMQRRDGGVSFLGRLELPMPRGVLADSPILQQEQLRHFFLSSVHTAGVELQATGEDPTDNGTVHYFNQTVGGIPIEGTYAVAVAHANVLTYARHHLVRPPADLTLQARIAAPQADEAAVAAMQGTAEAAALSDGAVTKLTVMHVSDRPYLAWRVLVNTQRPWEQRAVYIDASDGTYLTYRKTSHDGVSGHLTANVEPLCIGDTPKPRPMPFTRWTSDRLEGAQAEAFTDGKGSFKSSTSMQKADVSLKSLYVRLNNESGKLAGPWSFPLASSPADNDLVLEDAPLDQVDAFYHVHTVRAWLLKHIHAPNPQSKWAMDQLRVNVNLRDSCNAYYDGTLNFFSEGDGCLNTGRTAGIVYHEYGHGIHEHSPANSSDAMMDGQVSEGIADYIAATITNNPNMRGIFSCEDNFRSCVNHFTFCDGDCDYSPDSEVHDAGQVICAVWWEVRQQFIKKYGRTKGIDKADRLHLKFLSLVGDMNSAYEAAIAADDDDDGDPSNGTVNSCEINQAFAAKKRPHFPDLKGKVPCAASEQ